MRFRIHSLLLAIALALVSASRAAAADATPPAAASPTGVVRAFYTFHFAHDMGFTDASVQAKAAWLAPELIDLCRAYFKKPQSPDEVPDVDGDPFTDSQEYPKSFRVGRSATSGKTAKVPVVLSWPHQQRTISVQLTEQHGSWKISNIVYGKSGSLRALLSPGA